MKDLKSSLRNVLKDKINNYNSSILIIKRNWFNIIGKKYYDFCEADKILFKKNKNLEGFLYVKCYNTTISFYIEQYKILILEKINLIFGYDLIKDIRIIQSPKFIKIYQKKEKIKLTKEEEEEIEKKTKNIKDKELKEIFKNLIILNKKK